MTSSNCPKRLDELEPAEPLAVESEMEHESPGFTPSVLPEFEAHGFARRYRWGLHQRQ